MTNCTDEMKIRNYSLQRMYDTPTPIEVIVLIYSLEIITKVGRHFPVISISLTSLNVLLATNDFLANSIEFGILNSLFAAGGLIFLIQMHQKNKIQPFDSRYNKVNLGLSLGIRE